MRAKLLCSLLLLGLLFALSPGLSPAQAQADPERVIIYVFWGESCPYCHQELAFLEELQERYPQIVIRDYEIYYNEENRQYLFDMLALHNLQPRGVPVTFIGDRYWEGFSASIGRQIETKVTTCLETICPDPGVGIVPIEAEPEVIPEPEAAAPDPDEDTITLPFIGEISLTGQSLWLSTALISFVDGFNPCSLWVLSILLALVIHSGSRKKTLLVGLTFLTVTATVYGLFIAGLFSVFSFVGYLGWIQIAVALLALTFALINIKDYFWYKEGVSLTIDDKHKPKIYRDMRGLLSGERSTAGLIGATAVMAVGIALVELPCTAGFPVLWTNIMAAHEVPTMTFALLLGLYILIYLSIELIIFGTVVVTLKTSRFEEKQGRVLKLIGGMIMLALAITLLIDPGIMNNIGNTLLVFGSAFGAAFVILLLHRHILPRYGVYIGTETAPRTPGKRRSRG